MALTGSEGGGFCCCYSSGATEFIISIDRTGGVPMGVDIDYVDGKSLHIVGIKDGLIERWNSAHPKQKVLPGDRIVQVNFVGRDSAQSLLAECRKNEVLTLTLLRMSACPLEPLVELIDNEVTNVAHQDMQAALQGNAWTVDDMEARLAELENEKAGRDLDFTTAGAPRVVPRLNLQALLEDPGQDSSRPSTPSVHAKPSPKSVLLEAELNEESRWLRVLHEAAQAAPCRRFDPHSIPCRELVAGPSGELHPSTSSAAQRGFNFATSGRTSFWGRAVARGRVDPAKLGSLCGAEGYFKDLVNDVGQDLRNELLSETVKGSRRYKLSL